MHNRAENFIIARVCVNDINKRLILFVDFRIENADYLFYFFNDDTAFFVADGFKVANFIFNFFYFIFHIFTYIAHSPFLNTSNVFPSSVSHTIERSFVPTIKSTCSTEQLSPATLSSSSFISPPFFTQFG